MTLAFTLVFILVILAVWNLFLFKQSEHLVWTAPWLAISATVAACVFLSAGISGYRLSRHERFVSGSAWTGGVLWSEVAIGLIAGVVAIYLWRHVRRAGHHG